MDFGGQSEGGFIRPMCDGEALRYQSRRMIVRTKWARFASSRVEPQDMFLFLSQQIAGTGFLFSRRSFLCSYSPDDGGAPPE